MGSIALIGVPGSGKSAVGAELARLLGVPFTDVAEEIGGVDAVVDIGEDAATARAREVVAEAPPGVWAMPSWMSEAPGATHVVYLAVNAASSYARSGMNRPGPVGLVNPRHLWATMLRERDARYRAAATLIEDVGERNVTRVAADLASALR